MPAASPIEIDSFMRLFHGRESAYGVNIPSGGVDENGKQKGINKTVTGWVSQEVYSRHLYGEAGLGVIPINEQDQCYFGAIDVDEEKYAAEPKAASKSAKEPKKTKKEIVPEENNVPEEPEKNSVPEENGVPEETITPAVSAGLNPKQRKVVDIIYRTGMPLFPFRSKSGGLHLFLFFAEPTPASIVIPILQEFRDLLGLPVKTEIFPKQRSVNGGTGNWINLPYFGESNRRLIDSEGNLVSSFRDALALMEQNKTSEEVIARFMKELPFSDGPPCLQILTLQQVTSNRNNFLFSVARYFKSKTGTFEEQVREINDSFPVPVSEKELEVTIFSSHRKRDYSYKCNDAPLCSVCNKTKCKERVYGIGGSEVSDLSFGAMTQHLNEDVPVYTWVINGKEFKFFSESEIIKQDSFIEQSFRQLHKKPPKLKNFQWDKILQTALDNLEIVESDPTNTFDDAFTLKEHVAEFLMELPTGPSKKWLRRGGTWREFDESYKDNVYLFSPTELKKFLFDKKQFRVYTPTQIAAKLVEMGATHKKIFVDEEAPNLTVWIMPEKSLENYHTKNFALEDQDIDFSYLDKEDKTEF